MEIIAKEPLWTGKFLKVLLIRYKDCKEKLRNWESVERIQCNGIVAIIPITIERELILIRQYRPVVDSYVVEFPAGLITKGENAFESAFRELIEETGYVSHHIEFLTEGPVSPGLSSERIALFLAKDAVPASEDFKRGYPPDDSEDIQVIRTAFEAVHDVLEECKIKGDLIDLKVYGLIELARRRLNLENAVIGEVGLPKPF